MTTVLLSTRATTTNRRLEGALDEPFPSDWAGVTLSHYQSYHQNSEQRTDHARQNPLDKAGAALTAMSQVRAQEKDAVLHGRMRSGAKVGKENTGVNGWSEPTTKRRAGEVYSACF